MKVVFVAEVSKILLLNPHERDYMKKFVKREFSRIKHLRKRKKQKPPNEPLACKIDFDGYVKLADYGDELKNGINNELAVLEYLKNFIPYQAVKSITESR